MELFAQLLPEILITLAALVLFMMGVMRGASGRAMVPWVALVGLAAGFVVSGWQLRQGYAGGTDWTGALLLNDFAGYVKLIATGIGFFFVLLSWPTSRDAMGNTALRYGADGGEFFGLLLLSIVGVMLVGSANDMLLLFMGLELASIPTYIMVAMSRPLPVAQEAGVKYFYLGAMSTGVLLLGFAYLYGATGTTNLIEAGRVFAGEAPGLGYETARQAVAGAEMWQVLGVALVILGLCFKLAAVPLHFYASDVYTGAGTPVTALLSFVPKAVGIFATIKVLVMVGGNGFFMPEPVWKLLFAVAVLSMTAGNILALLTHNLKRVMAYSSIAHSGYMLVALTALAATGAAAAGQGEAGARDATLVAERSIAGVLFYILAYGIMNAGVFGVMMMLPSRRRVTDADGNLRRLPATSAETYDDIAGAARRHPVLAFSMAVCCISLIGIPLTAGFLGKLYVIRPAVNVAMLGDGAPAGLATAMYWLVGLTVLNAAIGAAYYLRIVTTMILAPSPEEEDAEAEGQLYMPPPAPAQPFPFTLATGASVAGVLLFGFVLPAIGMLNRQVETAAGDALAAQRTVVRTTLEGVEGREGGAEVAEEAEQETP